LTSGPSTGETFWSTYICSSPNQSIPISLNPLSALYFNPFSSFQSIHHHMNRFPPTLAPFLLVTESLGPKRIRHTSATQAVKFPFFLFPFLHLLKETPSLDSSSTPPYNPDSVESTPRSSPNPPPHPPPPPPPHPPGRVSPSYFFSQRKHTSEGFQNNQCPSRYYYFDPLPLVPSEAVPFLLLPAAQLSRTLTQLLYPQILVVIKENRYPPSFRLLRSDDS